jgi:hypothetical protein
MIEPVTRFCAWEKYVRWDVRFDGSEGDNVTVVGFGVM